VLEIIATLNFRVAYHVVHNVKLLKAF